MLVLVPAPPRSDAAEPLTPCDNPVSGWTGTIGPAPHVYDLTTDADGNILICGYFSGATDFDPTDGLDQRTPPGSGGDIFVTKVYGNGSYAWTYAAGGTEYDGAAGVAINSNEDVLVVGAFQGTVDFDPTSGVDEHTAIGNFNVFLTKLSSDGSYLWTLTFGQGDDSVGVSSGGQNRPVMGR